MEETTVTGKRPLRQLPATPPRRLGKGAGSGAEPGGPPPPPRHAGEAPVGRAAPVRAPPAAAGGRRDMSRAAVPPARMRRESPALPGHAGGPGPGEPTEKEGGKKPLLCRAHGFFFSGTRGLYTGLVAMGTAVLVVTPPAAAFPFDLRPLAFGAAFLLPGVVGLVMAKTTAGIGEEIKGLIIQKADETMAVIRETSSDQVRAINGIRDAQRDMAATLVGAQRDMAATLVGAQRDMVGIQKDMAGTLAEIRDSQKGMAGTLAEIRDLLKKNRG